jgi:5'-deoxynucleotidase YfbR-like HD superfamily hydrolase
MAGKVVTAYLNKYGNQIMESPEFEQAMNQRHHKRSSVGMHTLRVVSASIWVCYILKKIHVQTDSESVVHGALCHDLGILGRDDKFESDKECYREHPMESVEVAERLLPELNETTKDIIRTHMWPVTPEVPTCKEAFIVSMADKVVAVRDYFSFGSSRYLDEVDYSAPQPRYAREQVAMYAENRYSA